MPRQARLKSASGIYHIMLRGINQQLIFEDDEDSQKFLELLKEYKAICRYKIYAYCLMGNHIHLLLKTEKEDLAQIFKRLGASYVYWYNWKYKRQGHLFQDRYKSEPIEDDKYFLTVLRYIHQNPKKAGLCGNIAEYRYSSYNSYIDIGSDFVDIGFALDILGKEQFIEFNNQENEDKCLDNDITFRLTDSEASQVVAKISKCKSSAEFQGLDAKIRDGYIKKLKENGLSIRQISRLTGVSKGIVERL